jgi:hypothetical protein
MRYGVKSRWRGALVTGLVALALVLLVGDPASGTGTATIRVGSAEGASGDQITVRLEALGVPEPGLGVFNIDITYDPNVASPVACQKDPAGTIDAVVCNTAFSGNAVRVGGFQTSAGLTGTVALADITFRLVGKEGACGSLAPSAVEFADTKERPIVPLDLVSGSLCVKGTSGGSTPSGATPAVAAHPEGPSATPGAGAGLPPAAAMSATPGAAGESQAGGAAGTASPSADQESTGAAAPGTPGPTQMAASAPTSVAGAAGSGESPAAAEEADSEGWTRWAVAVAGAAVAAALSGYVVYRRLHRRTS